MSAITSAVGSVLVSIASSGLLIALVKRAEKRDASDARARGVDARESTARHRIDDGAHARAELVLERLHDDCRREVAEAREEIRAERDARLELTDRLGRAESDVAACEERHAAAEERLARLEARSERPPLAPEPAE